MSPSDPHLVPFGGAVGGVRNPRIFMIILADESLPKNFARLLVLVIHLSPASLEFVMAKGRHPQKSVGLDLV